MVLHEQRKASPGIGPVLKDLIPVPEFRVLEKAYHGYFPWFKDLLSSLVNGCGVP